MDAYSDEFRLACFARWLLRKNSLRQRRAILSRMEKSGRDVEPVKAALTAEHSAMYRLDMPKPAEPLNDHEQRKADLKANRKSYARLGAEHIGAAEPAPSRNPA